MAGTLTNTGTQSQHLSLLSHARKKTQEAYLKTNKQIACNKPANNGFHTKFPVKDSSADNRELRVISVYVHHWWEETKKSNQ